MAASTSVLSMSGFASVMICGGEISVLCRLVNGWVVQLLKMLSPPLCNLLSVSQSQRSTI